MKPKILLRLPALALLVVNMIFGGYWLAGFYYCQKGLAIWGLLSIFCLYAEKLFLWIRRHRDAKRAEMERIEAEEIEFEENLKKAYIAAKVEAEMEFDKQKMELKLQTDAENEEIMILIASAVERGVKNALKG